MMRLEKYLSECGIGSRKQIKDYIKQKRIKVDGKFIKCGKVKVNNSNIIKFDDETVIYERYRYYLMHKPGGVITATKDETDQTVFDILPKWVNQKDLFPVGRLDKDTEGLLLLTNNGGFAHNLLSPNKHVDKKYYVVLEEKIEDEDIEKLKNGVKIDEDTITKPAKVERITGNEILLMITEGKFHQVKRMAEAVGNKVKYLKRVSFGKYKLGDIKKGEVVKILISEIG